GARGSHRSQEARDARAAHRGARARGLRAPGPPRARRTRRAATPGRQDGDQGATSGDVTPAPAAGVAEPAARAPPPPPLDRAAREAWAAALASARENPSQPRVLPAPHASPETWQRGGKALTQRSAPTPQRADGAGNVGNGAKAPVPTE